MDMKQSNEGFIKYAKRMFDNLMDIFLIFKSRLYIYI